MAERNWRLLHSSHTYDLIQLLAGDRQFRRRLASHMAPFSTASRVADLGGGTGPGQHAPMWRRYVCLDLDPAKLRRFRARWPAGVAVAGDATACPFVDATFDGVVCAKVVHHLDDEQLPAMLAEAARILKPGGTLILADAVRSTRWIPRLMWRLDRGAFPRTAADIRRSLRQHYAVAIWDQFRLALFHDMVLCVARRT